MAGLYTELLSRAALFTKVKDHSVAGTAAITSDGVDCSGYEGVVFITSLSVANATNVIKVQQSDDDGSSDGYSDLLGSQVSTGTSDEDLIIEVKRPVKAFVRVIVTPAGSASTVESIWAIRYGARNLPVENSISGTQKSAYQISPAEGTA